MRIQTKRNQTLKQQKVQTGFCQIEAKQFIRFEKMTRVNENNNKKTNKTI